MRSLLVLVLAACNFPRPPGAAPTDAEPDGPAVIECCQLLAVEPALAKSGDTIVLEGTFEEGALVAFPGGVTVVATLLGTHRATAVVPAGATTGDLTVSLNGVTSQAVEFRRAEFALGLQRFNAFDDQASGAHSMPALKTTRSNASTLVIGRSLCLIGGSNAAGSLDSIECAPISADGSLGAFTELATKLATPRHGHRSIVIGRAAYVVGGTDATGAVLDTVETAAVQADGSLGPFSVMPVALASPRTGHSLALIGASLYVIGGSSGGDILASLERAAIRPDGSLGPFEMDSSNLVTSRAAHTTVVAGAHVYVLGGHGQTALATVERAAIQGDGSVGAFSVLPQSLSLPREGATALVLASSVYVLGGTASSAIERASLGADGSLEAFSVVPGVTLASDISGAEGAVVGNHFYLVGGATTGGAVATAMRAQINDSGGLAAFASTGTLSTKRLGASSVVIGDSLYVLGGQGSAALLSSVERAAIRRDGELESFTEVAGVRLVAARANFTSVVVGRFLYVLGGTDATAHALTSIERAPIAADGSLGPFAAAGALVTTRGYPAAVVVGGFLYVIGGGDGCCGLFINTIERAAIAADGSLGPFTNVASMTTNHASPAVTVSGRFLYAIGGASASTVFSKVVERAPINPDGSIGSFTAVSPLITARQGHSAAMIGRFLYVFGGASSPSVLTNVERAEIAPDGSLGAFAAVPNVTLTTPRGYHAVAVIGSAIYMLGGQTTDGSPLDTIERTKLE